MKKILTLCISLTLTTFISKAQTVNGIPIQNLDTKETQYLIIMVQEFGFGRIGPVDIDYGQKNHITRVVNDKGKNYWFNSIVEILNIIDQLGFELIATNLIPSIVDRDPISYYIMRRKKTCD